MVVVPSEDCHPTKIGPKYAKSHSHLAFFSDTFVVVIAGLFAQMEQRSRQTCRSKSKENRTVWLRNGVMLQHC